MPLESRAVSFLEVMCNKCLRDLGNTENGGSLDLGIILASVPLGQGWFIDDVYRYAPGSKMLKIGWIWIHLVKLECFTLESTNQRKATKCQVGSVQFGEKPVDFSSRTRCCWCDCWSHSGQSFLLKKDTCWPNSYTWSSGIFSHLDRHPDVSQNCFVQKKSLLGILRKLDPVWSWEHLHHHFTEHQFLPWKLHHSPPTYPRFRKPQLWTQDHYFLTHQQWYWHSIAPHSPCWPNISLPRKFKKKHPTRNASFEAGTKCSDSSNVSPHGFFSRPSSNKHRSICSRKGQKSTGLPGS